MSERYITIALLTAAGFIAGMIAAKFIGTSNWLNAKMTITLLTGCGYIAGNLLTQKDE